MFQFNLGFAGVSAPTEYPQEQQRTPREPLPEFPDIKDSSVETLRLEGTLKKRLPSMPSGNTGDLSYTDSSRLDAEQMMDDMRVSYAVSNAYKRRGEARAKAKNRRAQRQVERSIPNTANNMSKTQSRAVRSKKSTVLRNARDVLGMGTDLYK